MTGDASQAAAPRRHYGWLAAGVVAVALILWSAIRGVPPAHVQEAQKPPLSGAELERLQGERRRLVSELEHHPSISPEGLASPEAIAENEDRFGALVSVLEKLDGQSTPEESAHPKGRELAALLKQRARVERYLDTKSLELLAFLRTSWGQWKYEERPGLAVQFVSEDGKRRFKELATQVQMTQATLNRLDGNFRELKPIGH